MANPIIYNGKTQFVKGLTPFGFYDDDPEFVKDCDLVARFVANRLGYPIIDIELQDVNFYTAFEEAITTYGNELYSQQIMDNQLGYQGLPIPNSDEGFNDSFIYPNLNYIIKISQNYGSEAGYGNNIPVHRAYLNVKKGHQVYDLKEWAKDRKIDPGELEIRKVFYEQPPAAGAYMDPYLSSGVGVQNMLDSFGFGNMSVAYNSSINYLMMPLSYDVQALQAIELNNTIRRSAYSFKLEGTDLRIFPIPNRDSRIWFEYSKSSERGFSPTFILEKDPKTGAYINESYPKGRITNVSNVPFKNPVYRNINSVGRSWIFEYTLALCKEILGSIRGKYQNIPIPNDNVTLNYNELFNQAQKEKEDLRNNLRDYLGKNSRQSMLERKSAESEMLNKELNNIPFSTIYIG